MTSPFSPDTEIAVRTPVAELADTYQRETARILAAFNEVNAALETLNTVFGIGTGYQRFHLGKRGNRFTLDGDSMADLKTAAWRAVLDRLKIRSFMSIKRATELDRQLETGQDLPELTAGNIEGMIRSSVDQAGDYLAEKVREVYDWLTPGGWRRSRYKTNQKSGREGLGKKVVITYAVERHWSGRGFRVAYGHADRFRALDQVFAMLAGQKPTDTFGGELADAIATQTRTGDNFFATRFFKGRCYGNQSVHLEFKEAELLAQFNLVAGGKRIQPRFDQ